MKTSARLSLGFGVVLALMALIAIISILRLQAVAEASSNMTQLPLSKERTISDLYSSISTSVMRTTAIAKSADPELGTYFEPIAAEAQRNELSLSKKIETQLVSDDEKKLYKEMQERGAVYQAVGNEINTLRNEGKLFQAKIVFEKKYLPLSVEYLALVQKLVQVQRSTINKTAADIDGIYKTSRIVLLILSALTVGAGVLSAYLLTRSFIIQLGGDPHEAVAAAERIASGDLSVDLNIRDGDTTSLLFAIKRMRDSLANIVREVRLGTDNIAEASTQNASDNMDLSSRTELQAASLEETASTMHELTTTVKLNADHARHANTLSMSASAVATRGGAMVAQVVTTMDSIRDSSRKVVDIISVIDGIAFQTNILALNAAVEAARAGEAGRGFAVVASEVRTLAQRAASAAKEIKALIGESVAKVDAGGTQVVDAGITMGEIVTSVKQVTEIIAQIVAASHEQSDGIEQINTAIAEMDSATQQNAALVEQAAAAAESLQIQANKLAALVSVFKLNAFDGQDNDSDHDNEKRDHGFGQSARSTHAAGRAAKPVRRVQQTKLVGTAKK